MKNIFKNKTSIIFSFSDPEIFESADDQTEDPHALTFDDLLLFALQVAKGMEFLSSKNVGDRSYFLKQIAALC